MRVLGITDVYFPNADGISNAVRTLGREFRAKGHVVTLIAPDYGRGVDSPAEDIVRISSHRVLFDPDTRLMKIPRVLELADRLRGWRYDLVHIHTPFMAHYLGLALARRLRLPVVETYHTVLEEYLQSRLRFLPRTIAQWAGRGLTHSQCQAVDAVIVPSEAMRDVLYRAGVTTPITVVPLGIEPSWFAQGDGAAFRRRHGIGADQPLLLYSGRVAEDKNVFFLLDVLRAVRQARPDVLLVIAGEGPAEGQLRQRAAEQDLLPNLLFLDELTRDNQLLDGYQAADVFLFPSRRETHALGVLEAMAAGVPVVAQAAMGTREALTAGEGAVIAEANVADFADKTLGLLNDAERRRQLGAAAREQVRPWSASMMVERLLECYQEVARPSAPGLRLRPRLKMDALTRTE